LASKAYFTAGAAMSLSLLHGGPAPACMSLMLYSALTDQAVQCSIGDIHDDSVRAQLLKVCWCLAHCRY